MSKKQEVSRGMVIFSVSFYIVTALIMVFVNKVNILKVKQKHKKIDPTIFITFFL